MGYFGFFLRAIGLVLFRRPGNPFSLFTLSVESQHGLNGDVDAVELVGLKHDLSDLLSVLQRVQGRLRQQDLTVGRVDVEPLWAECVIPQVQHVLPAADYPVLHGVRDLQHGATFTRLFTNHQILKKSRTVLTSVLNESKTITNE